MTRSGFLGDYDVLGKTKYENVLLFKAPGFEPSRYREILVEDAQVVTATGRIGGLEAEQVRELLDHVNSELRHLQTKSEAPASSGRIRVRVAITTIETPNRAVNTLTTLLVGPVTTGGASLEFEAVDPPGALPLQAAPRSVSNRQERETPAILRRSRATPEWAWACCANSRPHASR